MPDRPIGIAVDLPHGAARRMHVAHVSGYADPHGRSPDDLLEAWPTLLEVARAVHEAGVRVSIVQAAAADAKLRRDGVDLHFVRVAGTRRGARRIGRAVRALSPDAIHLQGIRFPLHVRALRRACPGVPIVAQDHADAPPGRVRALLERALSEGPDAVVFTSGAQAQPMLRSGLLPRGVAIIEAPERSTHFSPGDRAGARRVIGVYGDPCIVWIGRLAAVKDPLTALEAFRQVLHELPGARLWCAFGEAPLLADVRAYLRRHEQVGARVGLLGRLPHARIQLLLRAADMFLASSLCESTGYAVIEALACGVPPVVTDIPAFRALTCTGRVGMLFPPGDAAAAADAIRTLARTPPARAAVRRHFELHLSPEALGRTLQRAYAGQIARARGSVSLAGRSPGRRLRVCLLVPGGVDRSGTHRVIPCVLALMERVAREVELHVLALYQEPRAAEYELLGARVHCVPAGDRTAAVRWLLDPRRRMRWDVLHALWMHPQGTAAALAGAILRTPVLLHVNGGDLAAVNDIRYGGRARLRDRIRQRIARAGADRLTVPSELVAERARLLGFAAERLTFGVPLDRWPAAAPRARSPGEPLHLLSVGTLNRVKDHATLLRALAVVRSRGVDARLGCVGGDLLQGALARLAAELGIAAAVQFHGFVPHAALRSHFDDAHALVVSSRWEADPIAALEAAVAGLAVVGTSVGHLREWAPHAAAVCEPADPAGLAELLLRIATDDAERLRLAEAAQPIALHHDADRAAARVLELYREMARA